MDGTNVEKTSICIVQEDSHLSNGFVLERLLDIEDGAIKKPHYQKDKSYSFENRRRIYKKDGPDAEGAIGVWEWSAQPSNTNPEKDFVTSTYLSDVKLIYVTVIRGVNTIEELIDTLHKGFTIRTNNDPGNRRLVLFRCIDGTFSGLYCPENTLIISKDVAKISNTVTKLKRVNIFLDNIIHNPYLQIYRYLDVYPEGNELIVPVEEVVKRCILNKTTWPAFSRFVGGTHSEHKLFKDFLNSIKDTIYSEVSKTADLDIESATSYIDDFIKNANSYLDGEDIEDEMLELLVDAKEDVRRRFEAIISHRWEEENKQQIKRAEEEIDKAKENLEKIEATVEEHNKQYESRKKEIEELDERQETIRREFDEEMRVKSAEATEHFGRMMADVAFFRSVFGDDSELSNHSADKSIKDYYSSGSVIDKDEDIESVDHALDLLKYNLEGAGVNSDYAKQLAAFLLSSVFNHTNVILAGPGGRAIADALSTTLFARTAGYVNRNDCSDVKEIVNSSDRIVCVAQFCKEGFVDELPYFSTKEEKTVFFLTPYAEDLVIEPEGLYNYALPLMTELYMADRPKSEWVGGHIEEGWEDLPDIERTSEVGVIQGLFRNRLIENAYKDVLTTAFKILNEPENMDLFSFLFAYIPYAIASGKKDIVAEALEETASLGNSEKELLKGLIEK